MSMNEKESKQIQELKWISVEKGSLQSKLNSKGIFAVLVPLGCLVTTGVLITGVYHMFKKDSKKQQFLMRCRVVSQGITIILAVSSGIALQKRGFN